MPRAFPASPVVLLFLPVVVAGVAAPSRPAAAQSAPRAGAPPSPPPAPLACLERVYGLAPVRDGATWYLSLPGGKRVPYDDGRPKDLEGRLADPDVEDAFFYRYHPGAIRPVTVVDDDPGRVRIDALFRHAYPPSGLTKVDFLGRTLTVHGKVADAFRRVAARLDKARARDPRLAQFLARLGGTYVVRNIAGTDRPSAHSYGVSIDINDKVSHYWRWQRPAQPIAWRNTVPQAIVDAFEAEGFIWGGRWYHYDTMHFEYRPELIDPSCYPPPRAGG